METLTNPKTESPANAQPAPALTGLTEAEATARRERGDGNNVHIKTSRSYWDIVRQNVFIFINIVLFVIGFIMILFGLWGDAFVSVGVVMLNVVVNVVQEFRAKAKLDKIALLTRPKATISAMVRRKQLIRVKSCSVI